MACFVARLPDNSLLLFYCEWKISQEIRFYFAKFSQIYMTLSLSVLSIIIISSYLLLNSMPQIIKYLRFDILSSLVIPEQA